jgi:hypothetical protein
LFAVIVGTAIFAIVPILLHYFGTSFRAGTVIGKTTQPA